MPLMFWKLPRVHVVHAVLASLVLYVPSGHTEQEWAPTADEKCPWSHALQPLACELFWYRPALHLVHPVLALPTLKEPAWHTAHAVSPERVL